MLIDQSQINVMKEMKVLTAVELDLSSSMIPLSPVLCL